MKAVLAAGLAFIHLGHAWAQGPAVSPGEGPAPPMILRTRVALPGVYGRMDHYGWDSKGDTVEIIEDWKRRHTITGLEHPQAAVYIPGVDRIAVSSQSGKLRFYDAAGYALVKTLDFGDDADTDNMRYDPSSKRLYVGFGTGARAAIAVVDPGNKASFRTVKVGSRVGPDWIITDGLKPGDKVIVQGFMKVRDGTPVSPKPYVAPVEHD